AMASVAPSRSSSRLAFERAWKELSLKHEGPRRSAAGLFLLSAPARVRVKRCGGSKLPFAKLAGKHPGGLAKELAEIGGVFAQAHGLGDFINLDLLGGGEECLGPFNPGRGEKVRKPHADLLLEEPSQVVGVHVDDVGGDVTERKV